MNNLIEFYYKFFSDGKLNNRLFEVIHLDSEPFRFQGYVRHLRKPVKSHGLCPLTKFPELIPYVENISSRISYEHEDEPVIVWTIRFIDPHNK